jgi:hypothetical protein
VPDENCRFNFLEMEIFLECWDVISLLTIQKLTFFHSSTTKLQFKKASIPIAVTIVIA